ncbi:hypothetical protein [Enterococcus casseliflavus]|nr:hypothetical protein [Enterococcus casseliflavus]
MGSDRLIAFDEEGNRLLISHQIAMAKKLDQFGTRTNKNRQEQGFSTVK